jgi:hypothetical protein
VSKNQPVPAPPEWAAVAQTIAFVHSGVHKTQFLQQAEVQRWRRRTGVLRNKAKKFFDFNINSLAGFQTEQGNSD